MKAPQDTAAATEALLCWYERAGRDLPWRQTRDPYPIWLSEVMLQQTGVATVKTYFSRFLRCWPTVTDLAAAHPDEVTEAWAGLGYYNRARNLHRAAQQIVDRHEGVFPRTLDGLMALPGVGRSTAGAILSLAFDQAAPILDGNVRRVLCRLYALKEDPRSAASEKKLWRWSDALTSRERPHDYTQAIMDLGAVICTPRQPRCDQCPLEPFCRARQLGLEGQLPRRRKKKAVPTRHQVALVLFRDNEIYLRRRSDEGMLKRLWEFPSLTAEPGQRAALTTLLTSLGLDGEPRPIAHVAHVYSHFKLDLDLYLLETEREPKPALEQRWVTDQSLAEYALHGAHKKAIPLLLNRLKDL